jgi:hypothetical protein
LLRCICWVTKDSSVLRAFTESIDFSGGCQWFIFPFAQRALQHQNLKDRPQSLRA